MSKVSRRKAGGNPAGGGTPAPASAPPLARPKLTRLQERQRVLQRSSVNRWTWEIIADARELHEKIETLCNRLRVARGMKKDLAVEKLEDAGLPVPQKTAMFGPDTFAAVEDKFNAISNVIAEQLGLLVGELPPPPVTERRAA